MVSRWLLPLHIDKTDLSFELDSRNCTKHHVRCDYMDVLPTTNVHRRPSSPKLPNLLWTPEIETALGNWLQTGSFPFPSLNVWPAPMPNSLSRTELRLIHHLCHISNELIHSGAAKMTIWCEKIPQCVTFHCNE